MARRSLVAEVTPATLFGEVLEHCLAWANLSRAQLAHQAGTSRELIDALVSGKRKPTREVIANLCGALHLDARTQNVLVAAAAYSRAQARELKEDREEDHAPGGQASEHLPTFGKLLSRYRAIAGMTQVELAPVLDIKWHMVQKLEGDKKSPGKRVLGRLHEVFALTDYDWRVLANAASGLPPPPSVADVPSLPIHDPAVPPLIRLADMAGRADDHRALTRRLMADRQPATVALVGLPGMGKTTLAAALAHDDAVGERWVDGVLWASLGEKPAVMETLLRWASLLRLPTANTQAMTPAQWQQMLHDAISARHLLIIIDDVWRFSDVEPFLVGGPNCAMLITTRFLDVAHDMAERDLYVLTELNEADSRKLLRAQAPRLGELTAPGQAGLERALLDWARGLPLALSLLGRHVQSASAAAGGGGRHTGDPVAQVIKSLLSDLKDASKLVNLTLRDRFTGNVTSLRIVVAASEARLSVEERAWLRALAVFPPKPETFSHEAALAVSDAPGDGLEALVASGLLEQFTSDRFTLHQAIRDYLLDPGLARPAKQRAVAYFLDFAERHAEQAAALAAEMPRLIAALGYADDLHAADELIRLAVVAVPQAQLIGLHTEIAPHLASAITFARNERDEKRLIDLLRLQARNLDHAARSQEAVAVLGEALAVSERRGDDLLSASLLVDLGNITNKSDQPNAFEEARGHLTRALAIAEQLNRSDLRGDILYNLSNTAFAQGRSQESLQYARDGLEVARAMKDPVRISGMLSAVGNILSNLGRYDDAYAALTEGAELAHQLGNPVREGYIHINMGVVLINQGRYREAEDLLTAVVRVSEERGDQRHWAFALANLAQVSLAQGHMEQAAERLSEALRRATTLHRRDRLADIYLNLGILATERRDFAQADDYLRRGRDALGSLRYPEFEALLLCATGERDMRDTKLLRAKGQEAAYAALEQARAIAERLGQPELIGRTQNALGHLHLLRGDAPASLAAYQITLEWVHEHREIIAEAHLGRALAARLGNDFATARGEARESLELFTAIGHRHARDAQGVLNGLSRSAPPAAPQTG